MRSSVTRDSIGTSLVTIFERAAVAVGARVSRVASADLAELLTAYGVNVSDASFGYSADLEHEFGFARSLERVVRPDTWISRAHLGIASTGTVLVAERQAEDRISALLCTRHVLVLPVGSIVATQNEASEVVRRLLAAGIHYATFITGPSRTSDIEKVLTLGAHGPAGLDLILVDSWEPQCD